MSRQDDVRGFVTRITWDEVPMWRVAVYDDDVTLHVDFVLRWDTAMRLANATVASARKEKLAAKRRRYSRGGKMRNHRRKTLIHGMRHDGTFPSILMVGILKAYGVLPNEIGLRLELAEEGVAT